MLPENAFTELCTLTGLPTLGDTIETDLGNGRLCTVTNSETQDGNVVSYNITDEDGNSIFRMHCYSIQSAPDDQNFVISTRGDAGYPHRFASYLIFSERDKEGLAQLEDELTHTAYLTCSYGRLMRMLCLVGLEYEELIETDYGFICSNVELTAENLPQVRFCIQCSGPCLSEATNDSEYTVSVLGIGDDANTLRAKLFALDEVLQ